MNKKYIITVLGKPGHKARHRSFINPKTGRIVQYTPKDTEGTENLIRLSAQEKGVIPIIGPLRLDIDCLFDIPKSWSRKKQEKALQGLIRPEVKPDWDNTGKLVGDALNRIAYGDDKSIVDG